MNRPLTRTQRIGNNPHFQHQSGSLTMVAVIVMAVIAVVGVVVTKGYISGVSNKAQHDEGTIAYNAAQSGAQSVLSQLKANNCDPTKLGGTQVGSDIVLTQTLNGQKFTTTFSCVTQVDNKCVAYNALSQAENGRRTTQLNIDCTKYPVDGPILSKPGKLSIGTGGKVNDKAIDSNCVKPSASWQQGLWQWVAILLDSISGEATAATYATVTLCHKPGTSLQQEMDLTNSNDISTHLGHGDSMGACPESTTTGSSGDGSDTGGSSGGDTGSGSDSGSGGGGTTDPGTGHTAVIVCHKPGTPAEQQLTIDDDAVGEESAAAHLGHGDKLGACGISDGGGSGTGDTCTTHSSTIASCNFVTGASQLQTSDVTLALLDTFQVSSGDAGDNTVTSGATKTFKSGTEYDTFTLDDNSTLILNDGVIGQKANFRINLIEQGACVTDGSNGSGGGGHVSSGHSGHKGWFGGKGWSGNKGSNEGKKWSGGKGRSGGRGESYGWSSNKGCSGGKGGTAGINWWLNSNETAIQKRGFMWRHDGWGCRLHQGSKQVWRHCGHGTDDVCTSNGSVTIKLAPGDYYVGKISLGANTTIVVNPPGVVKLYVNTLELGANSRINVAGDVGNLYLMIGNSMKVCEGGQMKAVVLAPSQYSSVEVGDNMTMTGAILGGNSVTVGQNINITYNSAVKDAIKALGAEDDQGIKIISVSGWQESNQK
ncbi:MAG: hypothetical protein HQL58_01920 [Magnetococcales bacterium]|nr:hypothetical protein [Magnetococcales bacterium]